MLISHNAFTYRKCQWWLRPLAFTARCQSRPYDEQQTDGYDIRLWWDGKQWKFRHGLFLYDASDLSHILKYCDENHKHVRLLLEDRNRFSHKKVIKRNMEHLFDSLCIRCKVFYPNITFSGGRSVGDWHLIHDFGDNTPSKSYFASNADTNKLNDLWPWLYAKRHNKKNLPWAKYEQSIYNYFDFL